MAIWFGQLGLNWLWSPIFFTLHMLWPALVIIAAIWALIAAFIWRTRRLDPLAAWCFVPYLAWVSFATMLNASVAILN
jgi:tryptophan-rich sensory protein